MKWPRGKYNKKRITGIELKLRINVLWWDWKPLFLNNWGVIGFHFLCFHLWIQKEYEERF